MPARAADPLPSWNDGPAKQSIITFVEKVTKPGSPDFVPVPERIATFDNDGTLWCEKPMPVQLYFALDRVKALAPQHPEWKDKEPFASLLKGDLKTALAGGDHALMELIMATHTGMTTVEFEQIVKDWIATAKHPKTGKLYTEMVYQPMLEVLAYLRANGFKNFIVSGGGIEFMRPWTEQVYGIPPEQVVGSSVKTKFEMRDGKPVLVRLPELNFNDDKGGKPVGINQHIGRRPIAAFGNSDGDLQMLQYTQGGSGARFCFSCTTTTRRANTPTTGTRIAGRQARATRGSTKPPQKRLDRRQHEERLETGLPGRAVRDHRHRHPAGAGRHDAQACRRQQRPPAQGLPERLRPGCDAPPHITMLQCFVRTADLDKVYAAEEKVFAAANVNAMKLEAFKYYYAPAGATGVAGICAKPTPEILKLQADIIAAAKPFMRGNRPHRRVHRPARRSRHRRGLHRVCVDVCAEDERRELQSARQHRRRAERLPRQDARRTV